MSAWPTRNRTSTRLGSAWGHGGSSSHDLESCPDATLLAAFCGGELNERDRETISSHLLHCSRCYFAFTESTRLSDEDAHESHKQSRYPWKTFAWAAALILTTGALTPAFLVGWPSSRNAASSPELSTKMPPAPQAPDGEVVGIASNRMEQIRSVEAAVSAESRERNQPHTRFIDRLTLTNGQEPTPREIAESRVQNDLAAVLLRRWQDTGQFDDAVAAFEQAQRAVVSNPRSLEARANLALTLEAVSASFQRDARKAWEDYLKLDSTSSRARDIKDHLETYGKERAVELSAGRPFQHDQNVIGTSIERK